MAGGALLLSRVSADSGYGAGLLPGLLVIGAGTGLVLPATAVTTMNDIAPDRAGLASGLMSAGHEIGAALGVACSPPSRSRPAAGSRPAYRHGFSVMIGVAAGLALLAAVGVPSVRPAPGVRVGVH